MDLTDHQLLTTDSRVLAMLQRREIRRALRDGRRHGIQLRTLRRRTACESIAAQTYRNFMCLVVDDCSKDRSAEVDRTTSSPSRPGMSAFS
jgi:hypothetical protein